MGGLGFLEYLDFLPGMEGLEGKEGVPTDLKASPPAPALSHEGGEES